MHRTRLFSKDGDGWKYSRTILTTLLPDKHDMRQAGARTGDLAYFDDWFVLVDMEKPIDDWQIQDPGDPKITGLYAQAVQQERR